MFWYLVFSPTIVDRELLANVTGRGTVAVIILGLCAAGDCRTNAKNGRGLGETDEIASSESGTDERGRREYLSLKIARAAGGPGSFGHVNLGFETTGATCRPGTVNHPVDSCRPT